MLKLENITKQYSAGDSVVTALRGVNLEFRKSEFVSILGPSGCGKTTLLNIIGGLDHYTEGDLFIGGRSTKEFRDSDWDTYRNHSIGFVFQSYNLIPHQSVLSNVELALTLSGVSKSERKKKAIEALEKVGLSDQINKKPNQMSGGQMQRVAIARALVNNPSILLADEPTGALDSETSVQIMELLEEISKDRLVVMVTHNPELAEKYSTRIIRLLDGVVTGDSNPYTEEPQDLTEETAKKTKKAVKKTSMSFFTALSLSFNNLMTKKARTFLTSFAGSIGIIGIALILALSNGIQAYIDSVQEDTLASAPITIEAETVNMTELMQKLMGTANKENEHPLDKVYSSPILNELINTLLNAEVQTNNLTAFKNYIDKYPNGLDKHITAIDYTYDFDFNVYVKDKDGNIVKSDAIELMTETMLGDTNMELDVNSMNPMGSMSPFGGMSMNTIPIYQQLLSKKDGTGINDLVKSQYDVIYGHWPTGANEVVLVVNKNNEISDIALLALGMTTLEESKKSWQNMMNGVELDTAIKSWSYEDICSRTFKLIPSCDFYRKDLNNGGWVDRRDSVSELEIMYNGGIDMRVCGIIRPNPDASTTMLNGTIGYTKALTDYIINYTNQSEIVKEQIANPKVDVITGLPFKDENYIEPTKEQKVADFKAYVTELIEGNANGKNVKKLADLYTAIISTPTQSDIDREIQNALSLTREELINYVMQSSAATGTDSDMTPEQLKAEIDNLSDDELKDLIRAMLPDTMKKIQSAMVEQQLASVPDDMRAMLLMAMFTDMPANPMMPPIEKPTDDRIAEYYDLHMPPTVSNSTYKDNIKLLGKVSFDSPSAINIYASTFESKDMIAAEIEKYNSGKSEADQITYTDYVALIMSSVATIIDVISYVLIAFVAISLIVSSIMIGIITYISVLERTKEIGILRAIGASKKDISRVFNAEAITIGFTSGLIGILFTILFCIPVNAIIQGLSGISTIAAVLPPVAAVILVLISVFLTFIAGLFPSRIAAKKDPVEALRSE